MRYTLPTPLKAKRKKATTIHKVFALKGPATRRAVFTQRRLFLIDPPPKFAAQLGKLKTHTCTGPEPWRRIFADATDNSIWISASAGGTATLLEMASAHGAANHRPHERLGNVLLLQPPKVESIPVLHALFRRVVGEVRTFQMLPLAELLDVLLAPPEESQDLFIGGSVDPASATVTLTRGNLEAVVAPLAMFRPSGAAALDPARLRVTDYGNTVCFGEYEATADAILYDLDAIYRRKQNARRRQEDRGFGPSLRRLRIQRGLGRADFPGVSPKTVARIERGETDKPHGNTLNVLAKALAVQPDEIETY